MFLGRAARAGLGIMMVHSIPSWAIGSVFHTKAYRERSFFTMGSIATVCAYGESTRHVDHAVTKVITEFRRLDELLSIFNPASEVSRVNAAAGKNAVSVSQELSRLLERARSVTERTGGLFDVTINPLMNLWGFRGKIRQIAPSDREIAKALEAVGMHHLHVGNTEPTVGLDHKGASIDLGGIGVGYAVDRAVKILKAEGIEQAFVNHSGDAFALGTPEDERGWTVGIPDPDGKQGIIRTFMLKDRAVSTSANYERFITLDTARYGHVMDVRQGRPGGHEGSCTVVAGDAVTADVMSTAAFSQGGVSEVLDNVPGTTYLIIKRKGSSDWELQENIHNSNMNNE